MDLSVPTIVRGEFTYRDVLLVDVGGDGKRHSRAAESEIKAILAGKAKDMVGHWWEAQLIHYGLPRSKVKDTCKVRLQQAMGQNKLKAQPPHLSDMEAQMKKEYAAAVRKAKAQSNTGASAGKGSKRAREDEAEALSSKKTKISVKVNGVEIEIDHASSAPNKQKATKVAKTKKNENSKANTAEASQKATVAKVCKEGSASKTNSTKPAERTSTPKSTAASQKTKAAGKTAAGPSSTFKEHHPDNVFQTPPAKASKTPAKRESKVKPEASTGDSCASPAVKKGPKIKSEHQGTTRAPSIKREGYLFDPDAMDTRADLSRPQISVTGVYDLDCAQITEQLPFTADKLRLFVCVDHETGTTWAAYELAMKSGVIKIDDIGVERKLSFGWRARDSETGGLMFGKGCFGDIAFYGEGQVRGCFYNLFPMLGVNGATAPAQFEGKRRPGPLWCGRSALSLKEEWDGFVKEAYGR